MKTKVASLALGTFCSLAVALVTTLQAQFAYVANFKSDDVLAYSIASNGALTPIARSFSGHEPVSVAITPLGAFHNAFARFDSADISPHRFWLDAH